MGYSDIVFYSNSKEFFRYTKIKNNSNAYKSIYSGVKIYDVNSYLFAPKQWDFWDKETNMLIPNFLKRKRQMSLKTHDEIINWYYLICSDEHGNIPLVIKYPNSGDAESMENIWLFLSSPDIKIEESINV